MKAIKDSVHDYVTLDPVAADLLDTPEVQRLRHVKQLSTVRLVYPSASHTRFEHSLGVYHLADRALSHLGVDGDRATRVRAAALLHDVGHGPYGHQTERLIRRRTGEHHDEVGDLLDPGTATPPPAADADEGGDGNGSDDRGRTAGEVLVDHGLDPARIAALVRGEGDLGQLVSGELDVDRMDYLVRDAHHTGVPYGTIDHGRLVRELRYRDGRLVLAEGNVQTAESLLLARTLMNGIVYRHHVSRIAGTMLERASERLLADGVSVAAFRRMADHDLLVALREQVPDLGRRIERRNLYKRAVWADIADVPPDVADLARDHEGVREAEREVAGRAGVDPTRVLLDVPPRPTLTESNARVLRDGAVCRLEDVSELVSALRASERAQWRLGVYAPGPVRDEVAAAATAALGLPTRTAV